MASAEYRGITGWTFNGKEAHAIVGRRLLVANSPETLKSALDRRAEPDGQSLADSPAYQAAKKAAGPNAAATLFVDMEALKGLPGVQKALSEHRNPMAAFIFAALAESLRGSDWLAAALEVQDAARQLDLPW